MSQPASEPVTQSVSKPVSERASERATPPLTMAFGVSAARSVRPWIVLHLHRPPYSGNYGKYNDSMYPGGGGDLAVRAGVEAIVNEFGVDLVFSGHVHNQELTYPVVNGTLACDTKEDCYNNPQAPVYVISGNPGNTEEANVNEAGYEAYTKWKSYAYGYTHLDVVNKSFVSVEFLSTALGGAVLEHIHLTKNKACNFGTHCGNGTDQQAAHSSTPVDYPRSSASALTAQWRDSISTKTGLVPAAQVAALVQLYHSTGGNTTWRHSDNWLIGDPCANGWYGVGCLEVTDRLLGAPTQTQGARGVTALLLPSNDLSGPFPGDNVWTPLASTLQIVELSHNLLIGTLPDSLFRLHGVHSLFLEPKFDHVEELRLKGSLPADLGDATGLSTLPSSRVLRLVVCRYA